MVVVVVQTDARVHTPGAGEGDEVPHLFLLGFFQRVHGRTRRARERASFGPTSLLRAARKILHVHTNTQNKAR
jgi:hypothetical protein